MKRVVMNETKRGSPDGTSVTQYMADREYTLPDDLAVPWMETGVCRLADGEAETPEGPHPSAETLRGALGTLGPETVTDGEAGHESEDGGQADANGETGSETDNGGTETVTDGGPTDDQVAEAIGVLETGNAAHWTNDGRPDVRAISDVLDARVSADQRDRVWAAMQESEG
ncbi:MAG TPA: hypothetical protein VKA64_03395 [Gammaproteobacteria bacterium]|nr:hypothetical protein [Gammaproteobacteria bacterium]